MTGKEVYVILRDLAKPRPKLADRAIPPDSPLGHTKSLGRSPSEIRFDSAKSTSLHRAHPEFEVTTAERRDAEDSLRDPRTIGIAYAMGISLTFPMSNPTGADDETNGTTWGIVATGASQSKLTGSGVTVAVLDTGIDTNHAAFADNVKIEEEDFSGQGNGDDNGHGTHCAGTIFGRTVDGIRIGVAPGVSKALIGKVLRNDGTGNTKMLFEGLNWAIAKNANVISMSIGFDFPGRVQSLVEDDGWPVDLATSVALTDYRANLGLFDAIMQQVRSLAPFDRGAVIVAAAGNESHAEIDPRYRIGVSIPAAAAGVISVGALQRDDGGLSVAPFSNTTPRVSAPGVVVRSAQYKSKAGLSIMSGTSMACPHVAGIAALWWESLRRSSEKTGEKASAQKVELRLLNSVRTDVFKAGVAPLDRGDGLVTAPMN